jgi:CheY-like chemotaxis protein
MLLKDWPAEKDVKMPLALVVDDNPIIREILRLILEKSGWSVVEAMDARGGLDAFRCLTPQLVTLDLVMPINDGFGSVDLAHTINAQAPNTVLIVVSAFAAEEEVRAFFHDREVPVLSKTSIDKPRLGKLLTDLRTVLEGTALENGNDEFQH